MRRLAAWWRSRRLRPRVVVSPDGRRWYAGHTANTRRPAFHEWHYTSGVLDEHGVSDFDCGRWARRRVDCAGCGDWRLVWHLLPLDHPTLATTCPGKPVTA